MKFVSRRFETINLAMKIGVPLIDLDLLGSTATREGAVPLSPFSSFLSRTCPIPR